MKNSFKVPCLILTILSGIILLYPNIQFQPILSSGDHGRDLYSFKRAMDGDIPYKDYWWVYGPLMPSFYAFFFKWLGISIPSVLFAENLLRLITGILFYLSLETIIPAYYAFLGAVWFYQFNPNFFFTYNHTGGVLCIVAAVYCLFLYIRQPRKAYLAYSLLSLFILSFIKINFGFANLFSLGCSVFLIDRVFKNPPVPWKKLFYILALIVIPLIVLAVYALLTHGLPVYALRQCFPYLKGDEPYHDSLINMAINIFTYLIIKKMTVSWASLCFSIIIIFSSLRTLLFVFKDPIDEKLKKCILSSVLVLILFYLVNMHEYFVSIVLYRSFWASPLSTMMIFVVLGIALQKIPKFIHVLLGISLFGSILLYFNSKMNMPERKDPAHYLSLERGKLFLKNNPAFIDTVTKTTNFLRSNLGPDELFFALPYDSLYYYLTDKRSPTRQLIFFDHIHIPREQEENIIAELEKNKVNWVIISNRLKSSETGLGTFGETYCPLIASYVYKNFAVVTRYGNWVNEGDWWGWNYGIAILERIQ